MIHSFSVKNFYSIDKKLTIDFVVDGRSVNDAARSISGKHVSRIATVIGPNASGKTNILKAIPFIKWLIVDSINHPPNQDLPIQRFALDQEKPSEISVTFELNKDIYTYSFRIGPKRILAESLDVVNKSAERLTKKSIVRRTWNASGRRYVLTTKLNSISEDSVQGAGASIIAVAGRITGEAIPHNIIEYWQKLQTNVREQGWRGVHGMENPQSLIEMLDFYYQNPSLKKEAEYYLQKYDTGITGLRIEKIQLPQRIDFNVSAHHKLKGKDIDIALAYESDGTKQMLGVLGYILPSLDKGGIVVIDEIDASLHPDIVIELIELFNNKDTNPHDAQLICSTHSHRALGVLDKYQVVLTEKNKEGSTEAWRLDEISGVRADDNYFNKYMAGIYGAIPRIE